MIKTYKYFGYKTIDIPSLIYQNSSQIKAELIKENFRSSFKKRKQRNSKMMISKDILYFLVEISFNDFHIFKELLNPSRLKLDLTGKFTLFLKHILGFVLYKNAFIRELFENLSILIEISSGKITIYWKEWVCLIYLFKIF